jgi:hypothetical protein
MNKVQRSMSNWAARLTDAGFEVNFMQLDDHWVICTDFPGGFLMVSGYRSAVTGRWSLAGGSRFHSLGSKMDRLRTYVDVSSAVYVMVRCEKPTVAA